MLCKNIPLSTDVIQIIYSSLQSGFSIFFHLINKIDPPSKLESSFCSFVIWLDLIKKSVEKTILRFGPIHKGTGKGKAIHKGRFGKV